jgi:hypothetical protein
MGRFKDLAYIFGIPSLDHNPVQKTFEFLANALVSNCASASGRHGPEMAGRIRGADLHYFGVRRRDHRVRVIPDV